MYVKLRVKIRTFCEIRGSKVVLVEFEAPVQAAKRLPIKVDHLIVRVRSC